MTEYVSRDSTGNLWLVSDMSGGPVGPPLFHVFDTVGDGSGATNAIGNYTSSPLTLVVRPELIHPGQTMRITQLHFVLRWVGGPAPEADLTGYGGAPALLNGIQIWRYFDGQAIETTATWRIKRGMDFLLRGYNLNHYSGATVRVLRASFPTNEVSPYGFRLAGGTDPRLEIRFSDNFTDLAEHRVFMNGYLETSLPAEIQ